MADSSFRTGKPGGHDPRLFGRRGRFRVSASPNSLVFGFTALIADLRGVVTCLIDTQLSRDSRTGGPAAMVGCVGSRSGAVTDTRGSRCDRSTTGRLASVAAGPPPSTGGCEPA